MLCSPKSPNDQKRSNYRYVKITRRFLFTVFFYKSIQYEQEQNARLVQHYVSILPWLIWHEDFMRVYHDLPRKTSRFHFTKRQKLKPKTKERTPDFI